MPKKRPHSIGVPDEKWQTVLQLYEQEREIWELLMIDTPSKLYNLQNGFGPDRLKLLVDFIKKLRKVNVETP